MPDPSKVWTPPLLTHIQQLGTTAIECRNGPTSRTVLRSEK
jgi:hypothetical protein